MKKWKLWFAKKSASRFNWQLVSSPKISLQSKMVRSESTRPVNMISPFVHWNLMFSTTQGSALKMSVLVPRDVWPLTSTQQDNRLCRRHFRVVVLAPTVRGVDGSLLCLFESYACMNNKSLLSPGNEHIQTSIQKGVLRHRILLLEPVADIKNDNSTNSYKAKNRNF